MIARALTIGLIGWAMAAIAGTSIPASAAGADTPALTLTARAQRFPAPRTATARFTQERQVSLVDETLRAEGTLTLTAPASFRLDLTQPEPLTLRADGPTITVTDAAGKTLPLPPEVAGLADFARTLTDLLLGARPPRGFTETWRDPDTVVLTPGPDLAGPFDEITMRFPPNGPLPQEIAMRERGGDRTIIRLHDVVLDPTPKGS